jgi:hypothetical protein
MEDCFVILHDIIKFLKLVPLKEILPFGGEALTSKQDIEEKLVPDRQAEQ